MFGWKGLHLAVLVFEEKELKVTGYSLGGVSRSKHDNSQCSLAPDYGYKRWSTDREAPRAYTQPVTL